MVCGMIDFTGGGLFGMRDVVVPPWKKKAVSPEELREAGIERLVAECGEVLRAKYVKQALRSMSKPTFLQDMLGMEYIVMVIDKSVSILHSKAEQEGPQTAELPKPYVVRA